MKSISIIDAISMGYRALTVPYSLPDEQWMLDGVISDMRGQDAVLVPTATGPEVWKQGIIITDED